MMQPIHTVQHVKSSYAKYQILVIIFTLTTLAGALLAVVSGFHLTQIQKKQMDEMKAAQAAPPTKPLVDEASAAKGNAASEPGVRPVSPETAGQG